jgi:hypothetical protein
MAFALFVESVRPPASDEWTADAEHLPPNSYLIRVFSPGQSIANHDAPAGVCTFYRRDDRSAWEIKGMCFRCHESHERGATEAIIATARSAGIKRCVWSRWHRGKEVRYAMSETGDGRFFTRLHKEDQCSAR